MVEESNDSIEFIYCGCGCGLTREKYGSQGREFRFIKGHGNKKNHRKQIKCACGCGGLLWDIAKNGGKRKFIHGHNAKGELNNNYKGGEYTTSGYRFRYQENYHIKRKKKYVRVHRLVWEDHYNVCLLPWIELDHINGDKLDNRIENLQPLTKSEHARKHNPIKDHSKTVCLHCGKNTTWIRKKTGRPFWHRWKNGYICGKCQDDKRDGRWVPD